MIPVKRLLSYLFIALILVGCGKSTDANDPRLAIDDNLIHIDSLMQQDPDSALQVLLSCHYEGNEFNEKYHSLLLSEVFYKTGMPLTNKAELQCTMLWKRS